MMIKTIILTFVSLTLLYAQDFVSVIGDKSYYTHGAVNVGTTPSTNQIIFSGASIRTLSDINNGTRYSPRRYMHYGAGAIQDSVYGYSKVLSSGVIEDTFYVWFQSVFWIDGTHYDADDPDTVYTTILDPSSSVAYASDLYEITLDWAVNTSDVTGKTEISRRYYDDDSSYAVLDSIDITETSYADSGNYLINQATYQYRIRHIGTYVNSDYAYSPLVILDNPNYQFTITPSSAYFSQVDSTDSDTTMTVYLINGSSGAITLNDITGESLPFTITPAEALPYEVAVDDTLSLTVTLNRDTVGTYSQTATLDLATYEDQTLDLYAQLVQEPIADCTPVAVSFTPEVITDASLSTYYYDTLVVSGLSNCDIPLYAWTGSGVTAAWKKGTNDIYQDINETILTVKDTLSNEDTVFVRMLTSASYETSVNLSVGFSSVVSPATWDITTEAETFTPPNAPSLSAVGDSLAIHLTIDTTGCGALDSLRIYRNGVWITSIDEIAYTDTFLSNNTTYSHYVTAYSILGGASSSSNTTVTATSDTTSSPEPDSYCAADYDFTHLTPRGLSITYNPLTDSVTYSFTNWRMDSTLAREIYIKSAAVGACCGGVPHVNCLDSILVDTDIRDNKTFTLDASTLTEGVYDIKLRIRTSDGLVTDHSDYYTEGDCACTVSTDGVDSFYVHRIVPDTTRPGPPASFVATGLNEAGVTPKTYTYLSWNPPTSMPADFNHYNVYRGDTEGEVPALGWTLLGTTTETVWNDTLPEAGDFFDYYVDAEDDTGNVSIGNPSDSALIPVTATIPPPNPPTSLAGNAITYPQYQDGWADSLYWTSSTSEHDSDRVYRNSTWIASVDSGVNVYVDAGLANNTQYSYYVTAWDEGNSLESNSSNTINITTDDTTTFAFNEWYVGASSSGGNNGTSWTNKWSLSSMVWGSIQPGDIIYLDGGTDSVVYYSEWNFGASGSAEYPITITPGNDAGHNGKVKFDKTSYGSQNINFNNDDHIILDGQNRMEFWHGGSGSEGMVYIVSCEDITVQYCYFNEPYGNGNIRVQGSSEIVIRYNHLEMGTSGPRGTRADNIVLAYGVHGVWIDHNDIIGNNGYGNCDGGLHCDNVQVFGGVNYDIVISNNFMYDFDPNPEYETGCHQMLMWESTYTGTYVLYNNIFYMPNKDGGNTILDKNENNGTKTYYIIHNTEITGANDNQLNIHANTKCYTYNNILHATVSTGNTPYPSTRGAATWVNCQNNMFGDNHTNAWTKTSLSTVQSWGAETGNTIFFADPQLTNGQDRPDVYPNQDFHPLATSPAVDAGIFNITVGDYAGQTLQELIEGLDVGGYGWQLEWEDIDGNPRDSTPTIGAYEVSGD